MKFDNIDGEIKAVKGEDEARADLDEVKSGIARLADIDPARIETFVYLVKVAPGTFYGQEEDFLMIRAGNLRHQVEMADQAVQQFDQELFEAQVKNLMSSKEFDE